MTSLIHPDQITAVVEMGKLDPSSGYTGSYLSIEIVGFIILAQKCQRFACVRLEICLSHYGEKKWWMVTGLSSIIFRQLALLLSSG
jgi:hypothetical protein